MIFADEDGNLTSITMQKTEKKGKVVCGTYLERYCVSVAMYEDGSVSRVGAILNVFNKSQHYPGGHLPVILGGLNEVINL